MANSAAAWSIVFLLFCPVCVAQSVRAIDPRSVSAGVLDSQIQGSILSQEKIVAGYLSTQMKVGDVGRLSLLDAHVMQVLDDTSILVDLEPRNSSSISSRKLVKVSGDQANGLTDQSFWRGSNWKKNVGHSVFKVTGTYKYQNALGTTRTVLELQPGKESDLPKRVTKPRERPTRLAASNATGPGKTNVGT